MNREDIIAMARETGVEWLMHNQFYKDHLQHFATLVAAAEREACEKKTGEFARKWWSIHCASNKHMETTRKAHDDFCALQVAIRARGQA